MVTNQKATTIKERYSKGYITSAQLIRYLELGVITQEEYQNIQNNIPVILEENKENGE
ncbi:MAG: XkdX family protein [Lachnospiraceae bacterium]|nr:XkdX family protein [Lachnospiraceae bacterium]